MSPPTLLFQLCLGLCMAVSLVTPACRPICPTTRQAVDEIRYADCMRTNLLDRRSCGDYLQAHGEVVFTAGETRKKFIVYIMDDDCEEHFMEFFQVRTAAAPDHP
jgi:hypothetical protein